MSLRLLFDGKAFEPVISFHLFACENFEARTYISERFPKQKIIRAYENINGRILYIIWVVLCILGASPLIDFTYVFTISVSKKQFRLAHVLRQFSWNTSFEAETSETQIEFLMYSIYTEKMAFLSDIKFNSKLPLASYKE